VNRRAETPQSSAAARCADGKGTHTLLKEVYASGATICMVTRDPRYACHAERSIHLFDGRASIRQIEIAAS
jgi:putative ABC transport system ATP-binding protein